MATGGAAGRVLALHWIGFMTEHPPVRIRNTAARPSRRLAGAALGLAGLVAVAGGGVARADATIAVAGPMTGQHASSGAAMRRAVAAHQAGAALRFEDDGCQAETAADVARSLVAAGVAVVIGHPCSSAAIAAAPIYAAAGVPFISTGARHGDLTDKRAGPHVYRLAGRDDRQAAAAADLLERAAGGRAIAILHDRTYAMSTLAASVAAALGAPAAARGVPAAAALDAPAPAGKIRQVMQFPFVASEFNYDALADKVAASAPAPDGVGAVLFAGYPPEAIVIIKALRARGVTAPVVGVDALATPELGASLKPELGEVLVLMSPDAGADSVAARTAAAVAMWRAAVAAAPDNPAAALATLRYDDGVLGHVAFDAKGDAMIPSYVVGAWRDGAWQVPVASEASASDGPRPQRP